MTDPQPLDPQQLPAIWRARLAKMGLFTRLANFEMKRCADELEAALASAAGGPSGTRTFDAMAEIERGHYSIIRATLALRNRSVTNDMMCEELQQLVDAALRAQPSPTEGGSR